MEYSHSIIISAERKRGQHLGAEERGAIQQLKKLGYSRYSNRAVARMINCSPSTVGYELQRGTPPYCGHGRRPGYTAKRGAAVYCANRSHCRRTRSIPRDSAFLRWTAEQVRVHKWSFDACVGHARSKGLFPADEISCTKTLYNLLWKGEIVLTPFDLPEALTRRKRGNPRISKRLNGKSLDERPAEVNQRNTFGHWESDTVLGRKKKGEPVVFTIVERLTGYCLAFRVDGKTTNGIADAMRQLHDQFGERFGEIFRSITTDNGSEFAAFSAFEALGTTVYFAHPYSAWERPVNERTNRVLRRFIPKGVSIQNYFNEAVQMFADEINALPRKRLGYLAPEELFDAQLDLICARP
ncbi:MAG: IS30 family transposase [Oscillospiraceae bacterium]|nr:IS30 family transposase [Oscillospiraceae bacterium]